MCVCVYMCMYTVCIYACMCFMCVHVCVCIHTYVCMCVSACVVLQGSGSWAQLICATYQQADMETCEAVSDKDEVGVEQSMEEGLMSSRL